MRIQKIRMRTRRIVRSSIVLFVHLVHNLLVILHFLPKEIKTVIVDVKFKWFCHVYTNIAPLYYTNFLTIYSYT